jgi:hypothetical protein
MNTPESVEQSEGCDCSCHGCTYARQGYKGASHCKIVTTGCN